MDPGAGRPPRAGALVAVGALVLLVIVLVVVFVARGAPRPPVDCRADGAPACPAGTFCAADGSCRDPCAWPHLTPSLSEVLGLVVAAQRATGDHPTQNFALYAPDSPSDSRADVAYVRARWPASWPPLADAGAWATRALDAGCGGGLLDSCPLRLLALAAGYPVAPPCTRGACADGGACDPQTCLCAPTDGCALLWAGGCAPSQAAGVAFERYADAWPLGRFGVPGAPDYPTGAASAAQNWAVNPVATPAAATVDACEAACAAEPGASGYSFDANLGRCALWPPPASRQVGATTPTGESAEGVVYGLKLSPTTLPDACPVASLPRPWAPTYAPNLRAKATLPGLYAYEPQPGFTNLGRYPSGCWTSAATGDYTVYSGMTLDEAGWLGTEPSYAGSTGDCAAKCDATPGCTQWTLAAGQVNHGEIDAWGWCYVFGPDSQPVADTTAIEPWYARGSSTDPHLPTFTGLSGAK